MPEDSIDKEPSKCKDTVKHGGRRLGAGRKKGKANPKKQPPWRVSEEATSSIISAAENSGHKPSDVLDWVMKNPKRIPKNLE